MRHPDLRDKLVPGRDISVGRPGDPPDCPEGPQDTAGHGTFVAGVAAAEADNGVGVAGVAPDAAIMPVRYARFADIAPGIRWAADHGADVINGPALRYETLAPLDRQLVEDINSAVEHAWVKGAVVVGPAGNGFAQPCLALGGAPRAICVAASDRAGSRASYSNLPVHPGGGTALLAPGGTDDCDRGDAIWSTRLAEEARTCTSSPSGYDQRAATSWAAPHVSGTAAILAAEGLRNEQIVDCLRKTSSNQGRNTPTSGYGIVDADAATARCVKRLPGQLGSGCASASGRVVGKRVGPAALGRRRSTNRRQFPSRTRPRRSIDRFCLVGGGFIRIGYTTRKLARGLSRREVARVRDRAILILTSSRRYRVVGVRVGDSTRKMRARVHRPRRIRVGRNSWYLSRGRRATLVFKVRRGRVLEIGLADQRLTRGRAARRFLRSFR